MPATLEELIHTYSRMTWEQLKYCHQGFNRYIFDNQQQMQKYSECLTDQDLRSIYNVDGEEGAQRNINYCKEALKRYTLNQSAITYCLENKKYKDAFL